MIGLLASIKSGVTTLTSRLTSTRAGYLDNLDAAVSTRLGSIKSIQRDTIAVVLSGVGGHYSGSNTDAISSVNTAKSIVILLGFTPGTDALSSYFARLELTNGTTVTATVAGGSAVTVTVAYQVVEFN